MITDSIDSEYIRWCIQNVQFEVEGEQPIENKLAPFIKNTENQLISEYLMPGDFLNEDDLDVAKQYIVVTAFADAVPSLDLVVTPTGIGVVNTETIAPASKERVERLIDYLRQRSGVLLDDLLSRVRTYTEWRASERGQYYCSTFLPNPKDVALTGAPSYDIMRTFAIQVESLLSRHFIGMQLMKRLREEYNSRDPWTFLELHSVVRSVVLECVRARINNKPLIHNDVWHLCQPFFQYLRGNQEYYDLWQKEMGNLFDHLKFKNDVKGAFYF